MPLDYVPFDTLYLNDIFIKLNLKTEEIFKYIDYRFCTYIYNKGKNEGLMCCRKTRNPILYNICSQHLKYSNKEIEKKTLNINISNNKYYKKKEIIYYCGKKGIKNSKCKRRVIEKGEPCSYHKDKNNDKYDIEYLRNISIFCIMDYLGHNFINDGTSRRYKDNNMNLVVNIKNQFYDNISGVKGGGAIDLLINMFKYSFKNSVVFLKTILYNKKYDKIKNINNLDNKLDIEIKKENKIYKSVPIYNLDNIEKVKKYLINKRKINYKIIEDLIKDKFLYSDKYGNCVFVDSTKTYSYIRSINTIKYILTNGKPTFFKYRFGNVNNVYIFESIIDCLSFRTLYNKDGIYIVTNGSTLVNKLNNLEELYSADNVYLCFDNDDQGHNFDNIARKIINNNNILLLKSIYKDYNEDLVRK
jgi:hypothetical protein